MMTVDHQWCFARTMTVLAYDDHPGLPVIDHYAGQISQGLVDADWAIGTIPGTDIAVAPVMHHLNPYTNEGLGGWINVAGGVVTNAALFCEACFSVALELWPDNQALAMRVFGAALHLVQDLTVPHHARCQVASRHAEYEAWLHDHIDLTPGLPSAGGIYDHRRPPLRWVYSNAFIAYNFFGYCDGRNPEPDQPRTWGYLRDDLALVRNAMVPLAVRTSAGFIDCWLHCLNKR
jgi:phospholipase C